MMDFKLEEEINLFLPKLHLLMVFTTATENEVGYSQNLDLIDLARRADQRAPSICTWGTQLGFSCWCCAFGLSTFPIERFLQPNVCVFILGSKPESSSSCHRPAEF